MNASAEKGSSSLELLKALSSVLGLTPSIAFTSSGAGKNSITASKTAWTPLFLNAEPHNAKVISFDKTLSLKPFFISSSERPDVSKYFSIKSSFASAAASTNSSLRDWHFEFSSSGISVYLKVDPLSDSFQVIVFIFIRSITPLKSSSAPMLYCIGTTVAPSLSLICPITLSKSAPALSILLTKTILGTSYLLACLQTVSDCGWTPEDPQKTTTAPSRTLNDLSTSIVKSTCPGVSIIFTLCSSNCWSIPFQKHVVAADVIVIPRSCSCSIQSITAAPSCTSPILCEIPV